MESSDVVRNNTPQSKGTEKVEQDNRRKYKVCYIILHKLLFYAMLTLKFFIYK